MTEKTFEIDLDNPQNNVLRFGSKKIKDEDRSIDFSIGSIYITSYFDDSKEPFFNICVGEYIRILNQPHAKSFDVPIKKDSRKVKIKMTSETDLDMQRVVIIPEINAIYY